MRKPGQPVRLGAAEAGGAADGNPEEDQAGAAAALGPPTGNRIPPDAGGGYQGRTTILPDRRAASKADRRSGGKEFVTQVKILDPRRIRKIVLQVASVTQKGWILALAARSVCVTIYRPWL